MKLTVLKHLQSKHSYSNVHKRKLIKEKLTHLKKQTQTPPQKKTHVFYFYLSQEKKMQRKFNMCKRVFPT